MRRRCWGGRAAVSTCTIGFRIACERAKGQVPLYFRRPRMWFGAAHRALLRCVCILPALCRTCRAGRPAWRTGIKAAEARRTRSVSVAASADQRRRRSRGTSHPTEWSSSLTRAEAARRTPAAGRHGPLPQLRGERPQAGGDPHHETKRVRGAEARLGMSRGCGKGDALRRGSALPRCNVGSRLRKDCCRP